MTRKPLSTKNPSTPSSPVVAAFLFGEPSLRSTRPLLPPFAALHTVREGKIASSRFYWNDLAVLGQLGLLG